MSLTLHMHPLSSYCQKVTIALYETATPFTPLVVNLGDPAERAAFLKVWPLGKFPVLRDDARKQTIPESSIIIDYLALHYPGVGTLMPTDPDLALQVRLKDRFFDLHIHDPMQRVVADRLRAPDSKDPIGVAAERARILKAVGILERDLKPGAWAVGDAFSMADCAAAPALFYANEVAPFKAEHPNVAAYMKRLEERPSYMRTFAEAQPFMHMFPKE